MLINYCSTKILRTQISEFQEPAKLEFFNILMLPKIGLKYAKLRIHLSYSAHILNLSIAMFSIVLSLCN